jgi:FkbM family methyltransferase
MNPPQRLQDFLSSQFGTCPSIPEQICQDISRHRRTPLVQQFADRCRQFVASYENHDYQPDTNGELFVLKRLADKGIDVRIIFDVGSNIGNWTLMAHGIFPDAEIHCFEIIPQVCKELANNVSESENIIVNETGLYDRNDEILVKYYPESTELSSTVDIPHNADHVIVTAEVVTGDSYMKEHGIEHIDFAKIDVEGSENHVLAGFLQTIKRKDIDVIQFEYGLANVLTRFLLIDFYALFVPMGYVLGKIYPNYIEFKDFALTDENFLGPNYLAVRGDRRDLIEILSQERGNDGQDPH